MKPLYLLSGLLCDDTIWSDIVARLDRPDVQVISFPGFDSIGAMAEHVLATAPKQFVVVGHSMGGRVALEVARRDPGRVLALGLLNTGVHPRREREIESRGQLVRLARERGMTALASEWLPPMMGAPESVRRAIWPRLVAMVERSTPASFASQIKALLNRPDAARVLPLIRVPTLLASGTADTWSPLVQHEAMRRLIPHAQLVAINNAGHMAPIEQPMALAEEISKWLGQI